MADNSAIEWTDATWNPIRARNIKTGKVGWHCEHATTGCEFCYAEGFNKRLGTGLPFKPGHRNDIELFLDDAMLTQPIRWRKPRTIFVCSMTDLFADFVPVEWIDRMFAVMALTPWHTYQVLTKRAQRMHDVLLLVRATMGSETLGAYECIYNAMGMLGRDGHVEPFPYRAAFPNGMPWPLPNVWLGVSAERQQEADERIPLLLQTPAAVRFISAEPLLGPIELHPLACGTNALTSSTGPNLDWVIAGGESGWHARPMSIQWARELRDQCVNAGVPFFFKQWGEWHPAGSQPSGAPGRFAFGDYEHDRTEMVQVDGYPRQFTKFGARTTLQRVGKKAAGRLLDGVEHNGFPTTERSNGV